MNKVIFIAEAGKNFIDHDWRGGAMTISYYAERAIMLIKAAKEAGADIIKFQCHVAEDEIKLRNESRKEWIEFNEKITPISFWEELHRHCNAWNIGLLITPMSALAAQKVNNFVSQWKIGSGNITDLELLKYVASTNKSIILSTGMSTQNEVDTAIKTLESQGAKDISLLYCKSIYPTTGQAKFIAINQMKEYFKKRIGYSDHSTNIIGPMLSVVWGAEIVEKHFTLDKTKYGPDHSFSLEPDELKWAVRLVREYEGKNLTNSVIYPVEEEIRFRMKFNKE